MVSQRQRAKKLFEDLQQDFLHSLVPTCLIESHKAGGVRSVHQSILLFRSL